MIALCLSVCLGRADVTFLCILVQVGLIRSDFISLLLLVFFTVSVLESESDYFSDFVSSLSLDDEIRYLSFSELRPRSSRFSGFQVSPRAFLPHL